MATATATASPAPTASIRITAQNASPDVETLKAVLATIPRVPGQPSRFKNKTWQCPNQSGDDEYLEYGLVYSCFFGPDGYDFHDRVAIIDVFVYKDAATARALWDRSKTKTLKAPALGDASRMGRDGTHGCVTYVEIVEANVITMFELEGFGTMARDSIKCRSWASLPTTYLKSAYGKLSTVFTTP